MAKNKRSLRQIDLRVYTRYERNNLILAVIPVGDAYVALGASLELIIFHRQSDRVVWRKRIANFAAAVGKEFSFDMTKAPYGCGEVHAVFTDRHGRSSPARVIQDKFPGDVPEWFGSREGIKRGVPKPWTPLAVRKPSKSRIIVECWGREYRFNTTSLIQQVRTRDANVLSDPIQFFGKVNDKPFKPTRGKLRCLAADDDRVDIEQQLTDGNLTIDVQTQIDYDGLARFDWALSCDKPARIDSFGLELPVNADNAEYFYHFPGSWGTASNASALPAKPVRIGFTPFIWLGDNDRGLAWIAESDRNWIKSDDGCDTEIRRRGGRGAHGAHVVMRHHLIAKPVRLLPEPRVRKAASGAPAELDAAIGGAEPAPDGRIEVNSPVHYTMAVQATPVKGEAKDAWDHRAMCLTQEKRGFTPRMTYKKKFIKELADAGVRTVVLFEHWSDFEAHSVPVDRDKVQRIVDDSHDLGLKILFYFGFLISDIAPEWRDYGNVSVRTPKHGYPLFHYAPQSDQAAWIVCLGSGWQDMIADGIAKTVDDFDIDGVYLDGTEYIWGCNNSLHGCGHQRADGSMGLTYPIFGVRSAMRRLYTAIKSRKPSAQVNVHNSTCMVMPTLGFATSSWDGEQFQGVEGRDTAAELLPLDAFRCEFMGRQWGVPAEFLAYGKGFSLRESWAPPLLHDIPRRPNGPDEDLAIAASIWRAMDTFGRKQATWHPYWENGDLVQSRAKGVCVSLYKHPRNGVLAVIANIANQRQPIQLKLNWKRLGLREDRVQIIDAITGKRAKMQGTLSTFGWKLLWLKPDKG